MKTYKLTDLIQLAKKRSPFYRDLYKGITHFSDLSDLPLINEVEYWKAASFSKNRLITAPKQGIVLRTGGTSGYPKTSVLSTEDWNALCQITVDKLSDAGLLKEGDHVANMSAAGNLYGSFLLISQMLKLNRFPVLELPISSRLTLDPREQVSLIKELEATVVIATPYSLVSVVSFIKSHKIKGIKITRFLYSGDLLLESQYRFIKDIFPNATITSTGYASSDAGFLGYADKTCKINEYRTDSAYTIPEIVDPKTKRPIEEMKRPGILLATNLTKTLIPAIRYPVGDIAMWMEPKGPSNRKLKLLGRVRKKENLIEIGDREFDFQDLYETMRPSRFFTKILGFQIEMKKNGTILFKIALEDGIKAKEEIKQTILKTLPRAEKSKIEVEIIHISEMQFNTFTYKSVKIVK